MRVNGESYFFLNMLLDFCALMLAARLLRLRAKCIRLLLSSLSGGLYAVLALRLSYLHSPFALPPALLLFACMAFGKSGLRALSGLMAGSLFLSGILSLGLKNSVPGAVLIPAIAAAAFLSCYLLARGRIAADGSLTVHLTYRSKACSLPAFRDSGNTLIDALTGLPVLVVSYAMIRGLLPPGLEPQRLSTLPAGFRLLRIKTAAGEKTLMCFHPDKIILQSGKSRRSVDAVAAISDFSEKRAVLPEALFSEANFHQEAM